MKQFLLFNMVVMTSVILYAQAPYSGTIFIDPDIITSSDSSAIQSTTYTGQGQVTIYDRRVPEWVTVNAYLFDVVWNDGLTSIAQVNPEFGSVESATTQAEKYAFLIGQLPKCLRVDIDEIWINKGTEPFGGGNNSILIHTGQSIIYENDGIIEETLVHEACHTSLDAAHATSAGWIAAQNQDNNFISTYAQDNPKSEDIAESYLTWLAVRYRKDKISSQDYNNITQAIPNRLSYFDSIDCDLNPFENKVLGVETYKIETIKIYPNPARDFIHIIANSINKTDVRIYSVLGEDLTYLTSFENKKLNVSKLRRGIYVLKVKTFADKVYKQ